MNQEDYIKEVKALDKEKESLCKRIQEIEAKRKDLILDAYTDNYVGKYIEATTSCGSTWMHVTRQETNGDPSRPTVILSGYGASIFMTMKTHDIRFSSDMNYVLYLEVKGKDKKWTITNSSLKEITFEEYTKTVNKLAERALKFCNKT